MKHFLLLTIAAVSLVASVGVGDPAPPFVRNDVAGKAVSIEDYRGDKSVVLVFCRYIGCSWCQMFIVDLLRRADDFEAAGASVIIVTNSDAETAAQYRPPMDFPFRLIPDPEMDLYRLYGVKAQRKGTTWNMIKKSIVFLKYLPRYDWVKGGLDGDHYQPPACFIIDGRGKVRYAFLGKDVADNPDADYIVELLDKL